MTTPQNKGASSSSKFGSADIVRLFLALAFLAAVHFFLTGSVTTSVTDPSGRLFLIIAALVGAYMAMNIGANDVANNVGPAVGSGALTLGGAIILAVIFESAGALIAGGDVVKTIKKGIIDPSMIPDSETFVWAMLAALLAAAVWLNIATAIGAPVSTTHSIVGGVLGAGIAAGGWAIADWNKVQQIVASWIISPAMGGIIAAAFLYGIKRTILYKDDMLAAGRKGLPVLLAIMGWAFSTYLILKGIKKIVKVEINVALGVGFLIAVLVFFVTRPIIASASKTLKNTRESIDGLFVIPLIVGAAFLSFAHGANDVANAIGPLAAINEAVRIGGIATKATIPLWVMGIGALGIAVGLALYGPKLVRTVGTEITELDKVRAFCVSLAAAITVIIATHFGLPVSSTHIAVGAIFGVGFLRELLTYRYNQKLELVREYASEKPDQTLENTEAIIKEFDEASMSEKKRILDELKAKGKAHGRRKKLKRAYREKLVQRSLLVKIIVAWVVTVPLSAIFAAGLFFMIRGIMIPA
ncbi:MAG: inorganic phosphate transporter [Maricaulaceae bacterium]